MYADPRLLQEVGDLNPLSTNHYSLMRSRAKNRAKLKELYGVDFPDVLFWLHEFIVELGDRPEPICLENLGLYPSGVLELLLKFDDLDRVEFTGDPLLHYRYYRDVPEFFTYLSGDCDGKHWGMLLDEPQQGFRGVAHYWSNDGAEMSVCDSVFDALIEECEGSIATFTEYLIYYPEDEEEVAYKHQQIAIYRQLKQEIINFTTVNSIPRHDGRSSGIETSTGLDILLDEHLDRDDGEAIEMLKQGRELWYWQGSDRSAEAYELMRTAYQKLDKHDLIRILDVHFQHRNVPSVNFIRT